eukprot:scaffold8709_cov54-Cylindrotheca_fusiformis.AAC.1
MLAVVNNDIALPASATVEEFASMYHSVLEKRVRQIRLNANTGARGKVPEGFSYKSLKDGYHDYIVEDDDSEEKREKKKA